VNRLSAIVLLLWVVCYGRCLAEQYGVHEKAVPNEQWCAHQYCHQEKPDVPPPALPTPCGVCDFIKSGGALPGSPMVLDLPVFFSIPSSESDWFTVSETILLEPVKELEGADTSQPSVPRMCVWMASTAAPVRGPNRCA